MVIVFKTDAIDLFLAFIVTFCAEAKATILKRNIDNIMDFLMMLRKLSQSADFTPQSFADRFFFILLNVLVG
ncbi:hypothetical protein BOW55_17850 [Flavobacterium sp. YO12]|nr:hypothetical protein BOW55_17850 [Flavobacterium sp. YO12]